MVPVIVDVPYGLMEAVEAGDDEACVEFAERVSEAAVSRDPVPWDFA